MTDTPTPGPLLFVKFTPSPDCADVNACSRAAIQRNGFFHWRRNETEFIVAGHGAGYGGVRPMSDDLNDNAVSGTYSVRQPTSTELDEFHRRSGGHLEK